MYKYDRKNEKKSITEQDGYASEKNQDGQRLVILAGKNGWSFFRFEAVIEKHAGIIIKCAVSPHNCFDPKEWVEDDLFVALKAFSRLEKATKKIIKEIGGNETNLENRLVEIFSDFCDCEHKKLLRSQRIRLSKKIAANIGLQYWPAILSHIEKGMTHDMSIYAWAERKMAHALKMSVVEYGNGQKISFWHPYCVVRGAISSDYISSLWEGAGYNKNRYFAMLEVVAKYLLRRLRPPTARSLSHIIPVNVQGILAGVNFAKRVKLPWRREVSLPEREVINTLGRVSQIAFYALTKGVKVIGDETEYTLPTTLSQLNWEEYEKYKGMTTQEREQAYLSIKQRWYLYYGEIPHHIKELEVLPPPEIYNPTLYSWDKKQNGQKRKASEYPSWILWSLLLDRSSDLEKSKIFKQIWFDYLRKPIPIFNKPLWKKWFIENGYRFLKATDTISPSEIIPLLAEIEKEEEVGNLGVDRFVEILRQKGGIG